jgi:hypothetical protein
MMVENIVGIGKIRSSTDMASTGGQMVKSTRVSTTMIRRRALVFIFSKMEGNMQVGGSTESSMVLAPSHSKMLRLISGKLRRVFGKKARE